ncbi:hypothetical protein KUCAC02_032394 [Chaenocephalus aceratus]|nr:hypothetical protein KUCAC02_032394 [Chaenocephalus aceratus]
MVRRNMPYTCSTTWFHDLVPRPGSTTWFHNLVPRPGSTTWFHNLVPRRGKRSNAVCHCCCYLRWNVNCDVMQDSYRARVGGKQTDEKGFAGTEFLAVVSSRGRPSVSRYLPTHPFPAVYLAVEVLLLNTGVMLSQSPFGRQQPASLRTPDSKRREEETWKQMPSVTNSTLRSK